MHIDPTAKITTLAGDPIQDGDTSLSVGSVACNALLSQFADETNLVGEKKVERFKLAMRLHGAMLPVEITVEEAALIKKLVAKLYGPLVTGQVWELIDNPAGAQPSVAANGLAAHA